ncbi:LRR receptor-like serine/threonine-protein kinase EFR [Neltuma alba]|uniref:LRR receptor-like serine/threonine-protein kinase EFR n=1 Tax=Neltuma alba TaxID=207710 RepID=UPI0010A58B99|nr:LRR receptor-like serine/threonine-protein kinase EFR [Prosopis alba]
MGRPSSFVFLFSLHSFMAFLAWSDTNIITDKSALLAFKSCITSDPHNFLANWSVSSSPCSWIGITCNTRHRRVHSLNLGGMDLKGTISPQLGNLSFLVELDLSDNDFHDQIPNELVKLHRLELLNLSCNDFYGQVPTGIGGLSSLEKLNPRNNSLNGIIPPSLFNLTMLETLDWNFNSIEGTILLEVGRLEKLTILRLAGNKLLGNIPRTISNLSSLESLSLSYNSLSGIIFLKQNRDDANYTTKRDLTNLDAPTRISYYEILQGTNGFDESNLLGSGSFDQCTKQFFQTKR